MKLVNQDYVGLTIEFKFIGLDVDCAFFKDLYTEGEYKKTGCFGCENLELGYNRLFKTITLNDLVGSCHANKDIFMIVVRKDDDNNIVTECQNFSSYRRYTDNRYSKCGCVFCKYFVISKIEPKCELKHKVSKEILRRT